MFKMMKTTCGYQGAYAAMESEQADPFFEIIAQLMEEDAGFSHPLAESGQAPPAISEQQLRALSRKHLLMMLRDLEKELHQERSEKEHLLLACRAGRQPYGW